MYSAAVVRRQLQTGGPFFLNVTDLPGKLAQPQTAGVSTGASTPSLLSPLSQNGTLFVITPSNQIYFFDGSSAPGVWRALSAVPTAAYATIQQDGVPLTQRSILNILSAGGLLATDDGAGTRTQLTYLSNLLAAGHGDTLAAAVVRGDVIVGNLTPKWARLALGAVGNYLRSNGTDLVYAAIPLGDIPAHNVLSATHGDTLAAAVSRGDLIIGNSTPAWARLGLGSNNQVLTSNGTDAVWAAVSAAAHNILSATHTDTLTASVVLGDLIAGNASPVWARVAGNITSLKKYLSQTGTGAVSAVPAWAQIAAADLSDGVTGSGAIVLAVSPTLTGTAALPIVTLSGKITNYNAIATVSNGVPSEVATVDLTAQSVSVATTTLYAVPASGAGQYRVQWNSKVTTPDTTASQIGSMTIVYTDPDGVVQTVSALGQNGTGTISGTEVLNVTTTLLLGFPLMLNCKASTNITYAFFYSSTFGDGRYNLHVKLEAL